MTAPKSRRDGLRKTASLNVTSTGSYVVTRGTGRRQLRAEFGCALCPITVALPGCACRSDAVAYARLLGDGAEVSRAGVVIERIAGERLAG